MNRHQIPIGHASLRKGIRIDTSKLSLLNAAKLSAAIKQIDEPIEIRIDCTGTDRSIMYVRALKDKGK